VRVAALRVPVAVSPSTKRLADHACVLDRDDSACAFARCLLETSPRTRALIFVSFLGLRPPRRSG
jgi:hypothetical protein